MTTSILPNPITALSPIAVAIKTLYGVATDINDYLDKLIRDMTESGNPTIARTGRVIEAAKAGFGIGYITSVVIIAVGQVLLGNPLSAMATVATAAALTNPVAMTCGAVGAIFYGWHALSDLEREEILDKLSKGLEIGIELIKSIVRFVIERTKALLNAENLREMKAFVSSAAAAFGRTLSDVTKKLSDVVNDTFDAVVKKSGEAVGKAADLASETYDSVKGTVEKTADGVKKKLRKPSPKKRLSGR